MRLGTVKHSDRSLAGSSLELRQCQLSSSTTACVKTPTLISRPQARPRYQHRSAMRKWCEATRQAQASSGADMKRE